MPPHDEPRMPVVPFSFEGDRCSRCAGGPGVGWASGPFHRLAKPISQRHRLSRRPQDPCRRPAGGFPRPARAESVVHGFLPGATDLAPAHAESPLLRKRRQCFPVRLIFSPGLGRVGIEAVVFAKGAVGMHGTSPVVGEQGRQRFRDDDPKGESPRRATLIH